MIKKNKTIGRKKAEELITGSKGRFMGIIFTDKKNKLRTMNCIYAGVSENSKLGYVLVKERKEGFKSVNLQTISQLSLNSVCYKVK
jgi:hypothetical protein